MTHYELIAQARHLLDQCDGGEVSDETLAAIAALEGELEDKVGMYCRLIADENRIATGFYNEANESRFNGDLHDTRKDRFKGLLFQLLQSFKTDAVKTDLYRVNIQKSPPKTRLRDGVTTSDLPPEFVRITEAPDLKKILEQHKLGMLPADVEEKVVVETGNTHLKIQPR